MLLCEEDNVWRRYGIDAGAEREMCVYVAKACAREKNIYGSD